jgi:hypothetical protein
VAKLKGAVYAQLESDGLVLRQSLVLGLGVNHEWRFELIFASSNAGLETWNPQSLPLTKH